MDKLKMRDPLPVDFDDYADRYEALLREQLAFFSKDRDYFSAYKVEIVARLCSKQPSSILDFGCGIGLSLPHLATRFPGARLFATDPSEKSLAHVQANQAGVTVLGEDQLEGREFDLIFVAGVFHHVPIGLRAGVIKRLAGLLEQQGSLFVFEHNPYNPVTRRMVATCAFDADAHLLSLGAMKSLVKTETSLHVHRSGYCLFVPPAWRTFRRLEEFLTWLPLGGQYFISCGK
jgi:trans-aconitate methyltransferase